MRNTYTDSHTKDGYGETYDSITYGKNSYDSFVWDLEQQLLRRVLLGSHSSGRILDFACGTGRVTCFLESLTYSEIVGLDVSDAMLAIARQKLTRTRLEKGDIGSQELRNEIGNFNVIVSFRFFLNAEKPLKHYALSNLTKVLAPNGIIVFNIHQNKRSLKFFPAMIINTWAKIRRTIKSLKVDKLSHDYDVVNLMSPSDVNDFIASSNLRLCSTINYAYLPNYISQFLPHAIWMFIEDWMTKRQLPFSTHTLYVCKMNTDHDMSRFQG